MKGIIINFRGAKEVEGAGRSAQSGTDNKARYK